MQCPPLRTHSAGRSGFSLVEVAISIAILAVAVVALLGLLPGGITNFRKAMDTTVTAQIAQKITHDFAQAEFNQVIDLPNLPDNTVDSISGGYRYIDSGSVLHIKCPPHYTFRAPAVNTPVLRYFDEQGAELVPPDRTYSPTFNPGTLSAAQLQSLVYTVNVRVMPRAALSLTNENSNNVAQITVQVARNPNNVVIPIQSTPPVGGAATVAVDNPAFPRRNLFDETATNVRIYTYYSLLGNLEGS